MKTVDWNSQAPLKLLQSMPTTLKKKNIEAIQEVIDRDKFQHSKRLQRDLCGVYAPFCEGCIKTLYCPCAQSYIRMKQAEGMKIEIAIADDEPETVKSEAAEEAEEKQPVATDEQPAAEEVAAQPPAEEVPAVEPEPQPQPEKKYIRIAIARKKR